MVKKKGHSELYLHTMVRKGHNVEYLHTMVKKYDTEVYQHTIVERKKVRPRCTHIPW